MQRKLSMAFKLAEVEHLCTRMLVCCANLAYYFENMFQVDTVCIDGLWLQNYGVTELMVTELQRKITSKGSLFIFTMIWIPILF